MNVSMQDAFNLGWKLASVLHGRSAPHLLHSYSAERQAVAKELIDFDREWAEIARLRASGDDKGADAAEIQRYFVQHGRYTAGTATQYRPSLLTGAADAPASGQGLRDRHALSLGAGHPACGCQACSPRPRRARRTGASASSSLPGGRSRGRKLRAPRAVRFPARASAVPCQAVHARGRRISISDRCPRGVPAGAPRTRHRGDAAAPAPAAKAVTGFATTRRCSAPTSRAATTSLRCAASTATRAAWSSCGRINTSRMCCRSMRHEALAAYFDGFMHG